MNTVFITGADRGVGFALCRQFVQGGWKVFAGQFMPEWTELQKLRQEYPGQVELISLDVSDTRSVQQAAIRTKELTNHIDMLINCAGIVGQDNRESILRTVNTNVIGVLRMVESFLPLMQEGKKRLCFVSSEAGSISVSHRDNSCAYPMSKTALNMAVRLMYNELYGKGYTFRLYHPGWVRSYMMGTKSTMGNFEPEETAEVAYRQFIGDRRWEDVLVMTDVKDEIWPY